MFVFWCGFRCGTGHSGVSSRNASRIASIPHRTPLGAASVAHFQFKFPSLPPPGTLPRPLPSSPPGSWPRRCGSARRSTSGSPRTAPPACCVPRRGPVDFPGAASAPVWLSHTQTFSLGNDSDGHVSTEKLCVPCWSWSPNAFCVPLSFFTPGWHFQSGLSVAGCRRPLGGLQCRTAFIFRGASSKRWQLISGIFSRIFSSESQWAWCATPTRVCTTMRISRF